MDQKANQTATSTNISNRPTENQIEPGNYKKGHIRVLGLDIAIENPRGSKRFWKNPDGKLNYNVLKHHYGYIKNTLGKDGDHLDVYLGPDVESQNVYVINQINFKNSFDEHKILLFFNTLRDATEGYFDCYSGDWNNVMSVHRLSIDDFKLWLKNNKFNTPITNKYFNLGSQNE
jgi:hypothetical protein